MKKRITTLMALVLALMLMCSMSAFAADTSGRGDDYWDWDNGQSFGWNIASSFTALDNNRQGKPIPFQDKSVYDAVAAGAEVKPYVAPAKAAFTFDGCYTDEAMKSAWTALGTMPENDIVVYGKYVPYLDKDDHFNYLMGYPDGTFLPNKDITRAEMATIIAKFADLTDEELTFTDIEGHWAQDYIEHAAGNGWIAGYEDGTFKPESFINRAETVTMINRVLDRVPSKAENLLSGLEVFSDCAAEDWFYCAIEEATNAHDYDRVQGSKADEVWKELKPNRDWTSFEK